MTDLINKEKIKLVDDEIIDLTDFNSIEIQGKNSNSVKSKKEFVIYFYCFLKKLGDFRLI